MVALPDARGPGNLAKASMDDTVSVITKLVVAVNVLTLRSTFYNAGLGYHKFIATYHV